MGARDKSHPSIVRYSAVGVAFFGARGGVIPLESVVLVLAVVSYEMILIVRYGLHFLGQEVESSLYRAV